MNVAFVIDAQTATALGALVAERFVVIDARVRSSNRCRWGRRGVATGIDEAVSCLAATADSAFVLTRPSSDLLRRLAWSRGHTLIRVPEEPPQAAWVAAIGATVSDAPQSVCERALQVLAAGPAAVRSAICAADGDALRHTSRPVAVARWAARAWRQCSWCSAGGLPGHGCASCGVSVNGGGT